jgi:hypothetical protein
LRERKREKRKELPCVMLFSPLLYLLENNTTEQETGGKHTYTREKEIWSRDEINLKVET